MACRPRRLGLGLFACLGITSATLAQTRSLPQRLDDATFAQRKAGHWAWQPIAVTAPPRSGHPVDAFLDARLATAGLARSAPAAPHVQLRRLWFDLAGLPPPVAEVERFTADPSDAAWERQVDALLASPHFAERHARHWLDLVRYAETLGHEFDFAVPNAWRYRDYVIRAFDQDLPFDQFLREHLAGDLLPQPRRAPDGSDESVIATGAFWLCEQVHAPVDVRKNEADRLDNQLDVLGKAMLGMTVACARCHDHKFDAITAQDYYALSGFVRSSRYVQAPLRPVDVHGPAFARARAAQRALPAVWNDEAGAVAPATASAAGVTLRADDRVIADAQAGTQGFYVVNDAFGSAPYDGPCCVDPEAPVPVLRWLPGPFWHSASAGAQREGELQTASFVLQERYLHVRTAGRGARVRVVVDGFLLIRDPIYGSLHRGVEDEQAHWLTFDVQNWRGQVAYVTALDQRTPDLADPQHDRGSYPADAWIAVQSVIASPHREPPPTQTPSQPAPGLWITPPPRLANALDALRAACAALPVSETVPALGDGNGRDETIAVRGNPHTEGAAAPRRFLQALDGSPSRVLGPGSGRLALAEALLSPGNPLPARVFVNRLWHHLFGRGLVRSVDNLGALGDPPSHPELLDWLAHDAIEHGWSQKHVVKRIVTSAAYRQDSRHTEAGAAHDADNTLWHRQNVRRLEAEALRDALLAVAGRLDLTRFGPPVELPLGDQPRQRGRPDREGPLDGGGRRSIYLAARRNFRAPLLLAFDQPTPFQTVGARSVSNVPAQALALANDPFVHTMADAFADRVRAAAATEDQRLELAFRIAFARAPHADERERARAFLATADEPTSAFPDLLHALLCTHEFAYRR